MAAQFGTALAGFDRLVNQRETVVKRMILIATKGERHAQQRIHLWGWQLGRQQGAQALRLS